MRQGQLFFLVAVGIVLVTWYGLSQCQQNMGCDSVCQADLKRRKEEQLRIEKEAREAQRKAVASAAVASRRAAEAAALQNSQRVAEQRAAELAAHALEDESLAAEARKQLDVAERLAREAEKVAKDATLKANEAEEALNRAKATFEISKDGCAKDATVERAQMQANQCLSELQEYEGRTTTELTTCREELTDLQTQVAWAKTEEANQKMALPPELTAGDVVKCYNDIYKIENGQRRHFTPEGYRKVNQPTPQMEPDSCPAVMSLDPGPEIT